MVMSGVEGLWVPAVLQPVLVYDGGLPVPGVREPVPEPAEGHPLPQLPLRPRPPQQGLSH